MEVWKNEKCCGNTSQTFACFYNSIETRGKYLLFLLENTPGPSSCSPPEQTMTSKAGITHWIDEPAAVPACHSTSSSSYSTEKHGWLKCKCDLLPTISWCLSSGGNIAFCRPNCMNSGSSTSPGKRQAAFEVLLKTVWANPHTVNSCVNAAKRTQKMFLVL